MADLQQILTDTIANALSPNRRGSDAEQKSSRSSLSGMRGVAVGAGAAALAPLAVKNVGKLLRSLGIEGISDVVKAPGEAASDLASTAGERVGSGLGDKLGGKIDEAGGPSGIIKDVLPFGGGGGSDDGDGGNARGVGKGRRMPVQQSVDIGLPIEVVYNQWTQFEQWPNFMHRVTRVTQEDDCTVSFEAKIWGKRKEFTAKILTQRPDERIKWEVTEGISHSGVVSFHELGPRLTRVLLSLDLEPSGMLEKAARGMRHFKRAVRADLHRFQALIEMSEHETGAWRGVIEDGELVEEHDPSYDEKRDYADPEDLLGETEEEGDERNEQDEDEDEEPPQRSSRSRSSGSSRRRGAGATGTQNQRSRSRSGSSSRGRGSQRSGKS